MKIKVLAVLKTICGPTAWEPVHWFTDVIDNNFRILKLLKQKTSFGTPPLLLPPPHTHTLRHTDTFSLQGPTRVSIRSALKCTKAFDVVFFVLSYF